MQILSFFENKFNADFDLFLERSFMQILKINLMQILSFFGKMFYANFENFRNEV